jgi:phosphatidate cytidylyltransferase
MNKRVLTSVIGAPALLGLAYLGGYGWLAAVLFLHLMGAWEARGLIRHLGRQVSPAILYGSALIFELFAFARGQEGFLPAMLLVFALMAAWLLIGYPRRRLADFALSFCFTVYLGLFSFLVVLPKTFGWPYLFGVLFITWANDVGAYYGGQFFGRHRLAPAISPNKTLEGALAGVGASMATATGVAWWLGSFLASWLAMGVLAAAAGLGGDLWESLAKREAGMKDSARWLPGHGGVLDRFDSLLFIAPLAFYLGRWLGP